MWVEEVNVEQASNNETEAPQGYEAPQLTPLGSLEEFTLIRPVGSQGDLWHE